MRRVPMAVSSRTHVRSHDWPQLITNPISQLLGMGEGIGTGFFELRTPELSSIVHINQFHMQEQLVIAPNHFSCSDSPDKQILAHGSRIEVFVPVALNGAGCQDSYSGCPRDLIDDPLGNSPVKALHLCVGGVACEGQHGHGLYCPPIS
jgi:hypothetical protein